MAAQRRRILVVAALLAVLCWSSLSPAGEATGNVTRLSEHLSVYRGPINVGIVRDGTKALLIDCGEGGVAAALPSLGIVAVDSIWFTHHHRDQANRLLSRKVRGHAPALAGRGRTADRSWPCNPDRE